MPRSGVQRALDRLLEEQPHRGGGARADREPVSHRLPDAAFPRSGEPGDVAAAVVRAEMDAGRGAGVFVSAEPLSSSLRGAFEAAGWTKPKLPWPR
jgi:hypothetical protein